MGRKCLNVFLLMIVATVALNICAHAKPLPVGVRGGDGKSLETAVIIPYLEDYEQSIRLEYEYIASVYGPRNQTWSFIRQKLVEHEGKMYDVLTIQILFSKEKIDIYFDITAPYQRLQERLTNN